MSTPRFSFGPSKPPGNRTPLVSILLACHNDAPTLADVLESILIQSHPAIQIIAIDTGSSDDTPKILKRYGHFFTSERHPSGGAGRAWNQGWAYACGEFVQCLRADTVLHPQAVRRLLAPLIEDVTDGVILAAQPRTPSPSPTPDPFLRLLEPDAPAPVSLFRRSQLRQVTGFPEDPSLIPDLHLHLRLAAAGNRISILDETLANPVKGAPASPGSEDFFSGRFLHTYMDLLENDLLGLHEPARRLAFARRLGATALANLSGGLEELAHRALAHARRLDPDYHTGLGADRHLRPVASPLRTSLGNVTLPPGRNTAPVDATALPDEDPIKLIS